MAIKTLATQLAADPEARARFLREGEAAARIRHPNAVEVYDVGSIDGHTFLVMEFLRGENLEDLLARAGALPLDQALDILLPVATAIAAGHEGGVVHRDVKPSNIFLATDHYNRLQPKVLDFGVSKLSQAEGEGDLNLTQTSAVVGTGPYLSPEQARDSKTVDARSDQFSLALVLFECLTGERAFPQTSFYELLVAVGEGQVPDLGTVRPDLPPQVLAVWQRATAISPQGRFPDLKSFGAHLLPFASPAVQAALQDVLLDSETGQPVAPGTAPVAIPTGHGPRMTTPAQARASQNVPGHLAAPLTSSATPSTFRHSAGEVLGPAHLEGLPKKNRSWMGWAAGGLAAAAGLFFVFQPGGASDIPAPDAPGAKVVTDGPTPQNTPDKTGQNQAQKGLSGDPSGAGAGHTPKAAVQAPATYPVDLTAQPSSAGFYLDGKFQARGTFKTALPKDGTQHTISVQAAGFTTQELDVSGTGPVTGELVLVPIKASKNLQSLRYLRNQRPTGARPNATRKNVCGA